MTARNSYLLRKYGITEKQYETLLRRAGSACAVCRRPAVGFKTRLAVDHDHRTGEIRGLLCAHCNHRIVGRHKAPEGVGLLRAAADYLSGPYTGWIVPPKKKKRKARRK